MSAAHIAIVVGGAVLAALLGGWLSHRGIVQFVAWVRWRARRPSSPTWAGGWPAYREQLLRWRQQRP